MSGFIAIINTDSAPVDRELLDELTASLYILGPDHTQTWIDGPVGLGHTLFRTTEEAQYEKQPATLDGKVWITGCIRIDGRDELLHRLGLVGKIAASQTPDSELILHAYRTWGERCLKYLLGDFAFVLWDQSHRKLICARDHFGMKQLCYAKLGNTLVVSNSIQCLRQHPSVSNRLNDEAIGNFLLFGDHRWISKAHTAFADIHSLQPAHYLISDPNNTRVKRYWDIPEDIPLLRYRKESEYLEHFQEIFGTAVSDRLRSPRVAVSLSGGMDSSAIAATIREIQRECDQSIDVGAVTVLYDSIHPSDERYYVDLVARCIKLAPDYIDGGEYPLLSPPIQTTLPIELYQPALWLELERRAAALGRVLLTGEAGDNLMSFSTILHTLKEVNPIRVFKEVFRLKTLYGKYPALGSGLQTKLNRLLGKKVEFRLPYPYPGWLNPEFEKKMNLKNQWSNYWIADLAPPDARHPNIYRSMMGPDWNADGLYMQCNFTLPEKRDPFLDLRMIEFVESLPAVPWLFRKHLLRRSMTGKLPSKVIERPKTPLGEIHTSLLKRTGNAEVNNWQTVPELSQFIDSTKIPQLIESSKDDTALYVNLRPLLLNSWLQGLYA